MKFSQKQEISNSWERFTVRSARVHHMHTCPHRLVYHSEMLRTWFCVLCCPNTNALLKCAFSENFSHLRCFSDHARLLGISCLCRNHQSILATHCCKLCVCCFGQSKKAHLQRETSFHQTRNWRKDCTRKRKSLKLRMWKVWSYRQACKERRLRWMRRLTLKPLWRASAVVILIPGRRMKSCWTTILHTCSTHIFSLKRYLRHANSSQGECDSAGRESVMIRKRRLRCGSVFGLCGHRGLFFPSGFVHQFQTKFPKRTERQIIRGGKLINELLF
jgi:hypothetical protein